MSSKDQPQQDEHNRLIEHFNKNFKEFFDLLPTVDQTREGFRKFSEATQGHFEDLQGENDNEKSI